MRAQFLLLYPLAHVYSLDVPRSSGIDPTLEDRQLASALYTIPQSSSNSSGRAADILTKQETFLYGSSVANGLYHPTRALGLARAAADNAAVALDLAPEIIGATVDTREAMLDLPRYDGLKTVDEYTEIHAGEWKNTLPSGPAPGMLTNYTQDLLFSMERLSVNPWQMRRLTLFGGTLAFQVDNSTVMNVSNAKLQQLFEEGHRSQAGLPSAGRYTGACDAYFYIDSCSGDFLPLAIRTNAGSNLIYTPADSASD